MEIKMKENNYCRSTLYKKEKQILTKIQENLCFFVSSFNPFLVRSGTCHLRSDVDEQNTTCGWEEKRQNGASSKLIAHKCRCF